MRERAILIVALAVLLDVSAHFRLVLRMLLPHFGVVVITIILLPIVLLIVVFTAVLARRGLITFVVRLLLLLAAVFVVNRSIIVLLILLLIGSVSRRAAACCRRILSPVEVQILLTVRKRAPDVRAFAVLLPPFAEDGFVVGGFDVVGVVRLLLLLLELLLLGILRSLFGHLEIALLLVESLGL